MLEFPLYVSWLTNAQSLNISGEGEGLTPSPSLPTPWFQCSRECSPVCKVWSHWEPKSQTSMCVYVCMYVFVWMHFEKAWRITLNLNLVPYRQVNRQESKIWKYDEAKWETLYALCFCIVWTFLWQCTHISGVIKKLKDRTIPTLAFFIWTKPASHCFLL